MLFTVRAIRTFLASLARPGEKNFKDVDCLVAVFKSIFTYCSARKCRHKEFLAEKTDIDDIPLPPVPVVTRFTTFKVTQLRVAFYPLWDRK